MSKRVVFEHPNWTTEQQDALREGIQRLGLCGCGSGTAYDVVLFLLERAESGQGFYDRAEDAAERWVEFGAHVLDAADILEHGTGIGCAWLTDRGSAVLRFLREFGTNSNEWPLWATAEVYE